MEQRAAWLLSCARTAPFQVCRRGIEAIRSKATLMQARAVRRTALFAILLLLAASVFIPPSFAMRRETLKLHTAAQGEHLINVEITETDEERAQGLMFRTHMPEKSGMLFFYKTPRDITMWMRNTYVPLDMVFIRKDGTVHRIEAGTEPLSETIISSQGATVACLELAGGEAARLGLKPGDKVDHPLFK
jgi:uncharacterized protein